MSLLDTDASLDSSLTDNGPRHRDALRTNILIKQYRLDVDIAHLISFNEELAHKLSNEPTDILPIVIYPPSPRNRIILRCSHFWMAIVRDCGTRLRTTHVLDWRQLECSLPRLSSDTPLQHESHFYSRSGCIAHLEASADSGNRYRRFHHVVEGDRASDHVQELSDYEKDTGSGRIHGCIFAPYL